MLNNLLNQNTDFFAFYDNFKKNSNIASLCIFDNTFEDSLITIGIPTYKRIITLKDAIESAISQNCDCSYNILVVDNNPERNDETEIFMEEYKTHPHISYYKNSRNLGMGGNWNRVAELSKTKWIVFLHDDDLIAQSFIKDILYVANKYQADVVNSGFINWYERRTKKPKFVFKKRKFRIIRSTLESNLFINRAGMPTGILWKRDVYMREGGVNDDYYPAQDWVYNALTSKKYKFLIYEKELTIYRFSINAYTKKETIESYIPLYLFFIRYLGDLVSSSKRFITLYSKLMARCSVAQLGKDQYIIHGEKLTPISFIEKLFLLLTIKIVRFYFDRKNVIGFE